MAVISLPATAIETYQYTGVHNDHPITLTTTFETTNGITNVRSAIESEKITETNTTVVANGRMIEMTQKTINDIDSEYFDWHVIAADEGYHVTFDNHRYDMQFEATISGETPMSLQGLIYKVRHQPLAIGKEMTAHIIIPWKTVFPVKFVVKSIDMVEVNNRVIACFKLQLKMDHFLGQLLPKSTLWVSKTTPHFLVKQTGMNGSYELANWSNANTD